MLLHIHAWSKRTELGLTRAEEVQLNFGLRGHVISAALAVVSLFLVWLMPNRTGWAGMVYGLMGPLHGWNGYMAGRAQARLAQQAQRPAPGTEHPTDA